MKKQSLITFPPRRTQRTWIALIALILLSQISYSQIKNEPRFYIGLGTSVSTFIGGDFGSTFAARYYSDRNNYYNDYYYPGPYTINELHNYRHESFFPLQVDLAMGVDASRFVSLQVESSFIWHLNGDTRRNYETGTMGNLDYIDRNDNSELLAIPIIASVKVFPFGRKRTSFYLTGGYGVQYMQESVERIRSVYDYNYYGNYNSASYEYPISDTKGREWIQGFKVGMGVTFRLNQYVTGDVELKATNFYQSFRDYSSSLSMYRSPDITNVALSTKIFFGL
jgi:hypothetical protein